MMSPFEICSILVSLAQCALIAWGIWSLNKNNESREAGNQLFVDIGAGIREQSAGIRALLERSQPPA